MILCSRPTKVAYPHPQSKQIRKNLRVLLMLGLMLGIFSKIAPADQLLWDFKVPVKLSKMPEDSGFVFAKVEVWDVNGELLGSADSATIQIPADGNLVHTFEVPFYQSQLKAGVFAKQAFKYKAYFYFRYVESSGQVMPATSSDWTGWAQGTPIKLASEGLMHSMNLAGFKKS